MGNIMKLINEYNFKREIINKIGMIQYMHRLKKN